jgi:choline monooxygenase
VIEIPAANVEDRVLALLGEEGLAQTYAPIEKASGLPANAFLSDDWLSLEHERVFRRSWVFAGAAAEIPKPVTVSRSTLPAP